MKKGIPILLFTLVWTTGFCFSYSNTSFPPAKKIILVFHHMIGKEELVLGNATKNIWGENMTVQKFKYYVSNFSLTDVSGKSVALPVQFFLIDEADSASKTITLTIPDIAFNKIEFLLGVDSMRNVSGIQTGALDPAKGMFWTWNSGYIMAKLEGESPLANAAGNRFTYHIGGFRFGINTVRKISLPVAVIQKNEIHINADINQWFKSNAEIRIAETNTCHTPGPLAIKFADNYANMFSIR